MQVAAGACSGHLSSNCASARERRHRVATGTRDDAMVHDAILTRDVAALAGAIACQRAGALQRHVSKLHHGWGGGGRRRMQASSAELPHIFQMQQPDPSAAQQNATMLHAVLRARARTRARHASRIIIDSGQRTRDSCVTSY